MRDKDSQTLSIKQDIDDGWTSYLSRMGRDILHGLNFT